MTVDMLAEVGMIADTENQPDPVLVDHVILDDFPEAMDHSPYRQRNTSGPVVHLFLYRLGSTDFIVSVYGERTLTRPADSDIADLEIKVQDFEQRRSQLQTANRQLGEHKQSLNGSAQQIDRVIRDITRSGVEDDIVAISDSIVARQLDLQAKYHLIKEIQAERENPETPTNSDREIDEDNKLKNSTGIGSLLKRFLK